MTGLHRSPRNTFYPSLNQLPRKVFVSKNFDKMFGVPLFDKLPRITQLTKNPNEVKEISKFRLEDR